MQALENRNWWQPVRFRGALPRQLVQGALYAIRASLTMQDGEVDYIQR